MADEPDDERMTTLEGVTSGRFLISTQSGARHLVDFDQGTTIRLGPPGAEWTAAGTGFGRVTPDGQPMRFLSIHGAAVGEIMVIENLSEWRITSTVRSIVPAPDGDEEDDEKTNSSN